MNDTAPDRPDFADVYCRDVAVERSFTGISVGTTDGCQSSNRTSSACSLSVWAGSGMNADHRCVAMPFTTAPATTRVHTTPNVAGFNMVRPLKCRNPSPTPPRNGEGLL